MSVDLIQFYFLFLSFSFISFLMSCVKLNWSRSEFERTIIYLPYRERQ